MKAQTDTADSPRLLIVLASLVALGPLTIDMYLPAMPGMVDALGTDTNRVQLTISSYLLGFSLFHLACGPLADRYGRKPILFAGLALYVAASLACGTAATIEELIFYRFLQGVAACVGPTLGRAIVRDLYGPNRAARALAHIAMIMALAPAIAPTLGGIMLQFLPWPAIFHSLGIYALIVFLLVWLWLPESLPVKQALHPVQITRNYLGLLRDRRFICTCFASALLYAGMVAFLSASSFIFIDMMGIPTRYFGALFLTTVIGYITGNAISTRLAVSRESEQVMWLGVHLAGLGGSLMLLASELWFHAASIIIPMAFFSMALGIVLPHAMAAALKPFPHMAGTASALFGFIQMGLSALSGVVMGATLEDSARPLALAILVASLVSRYLIGRLQLR
jgi:DHA1 family bicyclomycin/chloramphenicol resistance-like MFS transporter